MRRIFAFIMCLVFILTLCACGAAENGSGKIKVVTTVFPIYDWLREIIGESDSIEVSMLIKNGADLHSFEPSVADIAEICGCDLFIYVGGESDSWVEDALKNRIENNPRELNLLELLGERKRTEETKDGMEKSGESEAGYDEHIWLSVKNAALLCGNICEGLCSVDPENAAVYKNNLDAFSGELAAVDKEYEETVSAAEKKTLIFADRFPFLYLTNDYGLDYYAAFNGCSAESEASFKTVSFLASKMDELNLGFVVKIENSDDSLAKTVIENTKNKNAQILTLNSMQSVNGDEIRRGTTYLSLCKDNLNTLRKALS